MELQVKNVVSEKNPQNVCENGLEIEVPNRSPLPQTFLQT